MTKRALFIDYQIKIYSLRYQVYIAKTSAKIEWEMED